MRLPLLLTFFPLICSSFWVLPAVGQTTGIAAVAEPVQEAINLYHQTIGRNSPLYSGVEYIDISRYSKGHPFFLKDDWQRGSISFDGVVYPNVPMLYDVAKDVLVIGYAEDTDPIVKFVLVPTKVPFFTLAGHHFLHLKDTTQALEAGFYEQLYKGQVMVVAKRRKTTVDRPSELIFNDADRYYLYKEGQYHPISSKGSVLKVLKEHRKELTALLREENLSFGIEKEKALVRLAHYFDTLNGAK